MQFVTVYGREEVSTNAGGSTNADSPVALPAAPTSAASSSCGADSTLTAELLREVPLRPPFQMEVASGYCLGTGITLSHSLVPGFAICYLTYDSSLFWINFPPTDPDPSIANVNRSRPSIPWRRECDLLPYPLIAWHR